VCLCLCAWACRKIDSSFLLWALSSVGFLSFLPSSAFNSNIQFEEQLEDRTCICDADDDNKRTIQVVLGLTGSNGLNGWL
jgi:hypothetical protein